MNFQESIINGGEALFARDFGFDRSKYLNASEALNCIRKQWYRHHTPEAEIDEPKDRGYARRGAHGEKFVVDALRAANEPLEMAGKDQWSMQDEKRKVSSTPDGYLAYPTEWCGLEIKTIDPRTNRANLPRPAHVGQLQIAMALIDQNIDRPDGVTLERGYLLYMDASNYYDVVDFEVAFDHTILDRMAKRASKVLRSKSDANLDREGKTQGGKECKTCGFREICGVDVKALGKGRKRANRGSAFDDAATRYMEIKDEKERLDNEMEGLKEDMKLGLRRRSTVEAKVGNISVTLQTVAGRTTLDKKAVKAAGIDLTPFEKRGADSERLTVKRI